MINIFKSILFLMAIFISSSIFTANALANINTLSTVAYEVVNFEDGLTITDVEVTQSAVIVTFEYPRSINLANLGIIFMYSSFLADTIDFDRITGIETDWDVELYEGRLVFTFNTSQHFNISTENLYFVDFVYGSSLSRAIFNEQEVGMWPVWKPFNPEDFNTLEEGLLYSVIGESVVYFMDYVQPIGEILTQGEIEMEIISTITIGNRQFARSHTIVSVNGIEFDQELWGSWIEFAVPLLEWGDALPFDAPISIDNIGRAVFYDEETNTMYFMVSHFSAHLEEDTEKVYLELETLQINSGVQVNTTIPNVNLNEIANNHMASFTMDIPSIITGSTLIYPNPLEGTNYESVQDIIETHGVMVFDELDIYLGEGITLTNIHLDGDIIRLQYRSLSNWVIWDNTDWVNVQLTSDNHFWPMLLSRSTFMEMDENFMPLSDYAHTEVIYFIGEFDILMTPWIFIMEEEAQSQDFENLQLVLSSESILNSEPFNVSTSFYSPFIIGERMFDGDYEVLIEVDNQEFILNSLSVANSAIYIELRDALVLEEIITTDNFGNPSNLDEFFTLQLVFEDGNTSYIEDISRSVLWFDTWAYEEGLTDFTTVFIDFFGLSINVSQLVGVIINGTLVEVN